MKTEVVSAITRLKNQFPSKNFRILFDTETMEDFSFKWK